MAEPFTLSDAVTVGIIADMAQKNKVVSWLPKRGPVVAGTARCVGTEYGCAAAEGTDVREQFLRITTKMGLEHFMSIPDAMARVREGTLSVGDFS